jgi:putative tryptophan/tyrosine transport system substrate-binding protein
MRRRELITILGGAVVGWSFAARAQEKAMPVIGLLNVYSPPTNLGEVGRGPIVECLNQTGYFEGQKVAIDRRWAESHYDRLLTLAADLVARKVDVIVAFDGTPPALAAKSATSTIPIVFMAVGNPVGIGLVASLPGQAATSPASPTSPSS